MTLQQGPGPRPTTLSEGENCMRVSGSRMAGSLLPAARPAETRLPRRSSSAAVYPSRVARRSHVNVQTRHRRAQRLDVDTDKVGRDVQRGQALPTITSPRLPD